MHDVLRHDDPELVLLCAVCFGKPKITSLKEEDRLGLLDYIKINKLSYISFLLKRLATEYGIPSSDSKVKSLWYIFNTDLFQP